jgi:ribosomal protein S27AE
MEELQPQDIEDLLQGLEEEYGAGEVPAPEVETKVRVCPKCGKHNLENAWHCIDCGTTLSVKTLMDVEDGQPSMAPIAGERALSSLSPHFEQDVAELLDTALQDDESVVWGCNITQISRTPPFRLGYLLVTSQRLICVEFESEVEGRGVQLGCLLEVLQVLLSLPKEVGLEDGHKVQVRPKRPWIGATVPAVNCPSYPLTPKELASRRGAVYDLESLVSAHLESAWFGDMFFVSLTAGFHQDRKATFTSYAPHEAQELHKLLAAWL